MDNSRISDDILLRWMEEGLKSDEMKQFQTDSHAQQYEHLIKSTGDLRIASINKEESLKAIQKKINYQEKKPKVRRRNILITAALLISALIVGYSLWPKRLIIKTEVGQPMAHLLPDGSSVQLNANTTLSYDPAAYSKNRKIRLKGEAFFDVQKGSTFEVYTANGSIQVIGTSFNVLSTDDILMVSCKTGKVKVINKTIEKILEPGDRIRTEENLLILQDKVKLEGISSWINGETIYESIPLTDVIRALENQFNLQIHIDKSLTEDIFTGSFIHSDQQKALEMVFAPMGLTYETIGNQKLQVITR